MCSAKSINQIMWNHWRLITLCTSLKCYLNMKTDYLNHISAFPYAIFWKVCSTLKRPDPSICDKCITCTWTLLITHMSGDFLDIGVLCTVIINDPLIFTQCEFLKAFKKPLDLPTKMNMMYCINWGFTEPLFILRWQFGNPLSFQMSYLLYEIYF